MHVIFTDETNMRPGDHARFFIYGGLMMPVQRLRDLHCRVERIRRDAGFKPTDVFKFNARSKPGQVSRGGHTDAKRQVLKACQELDCKFIAHVVHHEIVKNQDKEKWVTWAANKVIGRYNHFLRNEALDYGMCVVDCLPVANVQWNYLREKFVRGLVFPPPKGDVRLDRIVLFAASTDNTSQASSARDIVLGTFRCCVNNPRNVEAARAMMSDVAQLMWHRRDGDTYHIGGREWIHSPQNLDDYPILKPEYEVLIAHINQLLRDEDSEATGAAAS